MRGLGSISQYVSQFGPPAIVAAHAPHADVSDRLAVEKAAVHWVHQAEGILLQNHHHVLALGEDRERGQGEMREDRENREDREDRENREDRDYIEDTDDRDER